MTRLREKILEQNGLIPIYSKVRDQERLTPADALQLYSVRDLNALGVLANIVRERKNGNRAYYIINRHINYSNICILSCQFCAFAKKKRDSDAYEYSIQQIIDKVTEALKIGVTEIHIVGGLHPSFKFDYYEEMLRSLKSVDSKLHLKAFTAIEILHLAWVGKMKVSQVLEKLRAAGLDSLPGGGAEVFSQRVRDQICRGKETAEEWLDVHRTWHRLGGRSTCTMLYGHVETIEERVDHLERLRKLQDETSGFTAFIPLPFHSENNFLSHLPEPSGFENLRNLAIARIYLDNFDHIKCYWINHTLKLAQISLNYGVDDLDGTVIEEKIYHMAGAKTPQEQTAGELIKAIREAGRDPVQRDSLYQEVKRPLNEIRRDEEKETSTFDSKVLKANLATA